MKKIMIYYYLVLAMGLIEVPAMASGDRVSKVPSEWYLLPEDGGKVPTEQEPVSSLGLRETLNKILSANLQAFDGVTGIALQKPPEVLGHPRDWKPWGLDAFSFDLSVSAGGVLGALILEGSPSVKALWRRVDGNKPNPKLSQFGQSPADIVITPETSPQDILKQLEVAISAALSSGLIKNEVNFRKNITRLVQQFQAQTVQLENVQTNPAWPLISFRLELNIDANGMVQPAVRVGSALNFRLDWFRGNSARAHQKKNPLRADADLGRSLPELVKKLSEDLLTVSQEAKNIQKEGYVPELGLIGIGLSASGDAGVAGGSATLTGTLVFQHDRDSAIVEAEPITSENRYIALISDGAAESQLQYAEREGVSYERRKALGSPQEDRVLYQVDRSKFRKGLRRAVQMSEFFVNGVSKATTLKNFKNSEIDAAFQLSISGTLGLVTVSGFGNLEIDFVKPNI